MVTVPLGIGSYRRASAFVPEVRMVNLNNWHEVDWIAALSRDYAQTEAGLTSFFPEHP